MKSDMPEVTLALAGLAAGLAFELHRIDPQPQIIGPASNRYVVLVEP